MEHDRDEQGARRAPGRIEHAAEHEREDDLLERGTDILAEHDVRAVEQTEQERRPEPSADLAHASPQSREQEARVSVSSAMPTAIVPTSNQAMNEA